MSTGKRSAIGGFADTCVIYYEPQDKCWVAHSVRTDQIGTGDCVVGALASLLRAVEFIMEDAAHNPTLAVFREAPQEIQDKLETAKPLPKEVFEIAHKMALGKWPDDLQPKFMAERDRPYKTTTRERAVAV